MQDYFEPLVQKEQMEEKMKSIKEQKCRAITCKSVSHQTVVYFTDLLPNCGLSVSQRSVMYRTVEHNC